MKKDISYICNECGFITRKWLGKCPECGSWDSFSEVLKEKTPNKKTQTILKPQKLNEIKSINHNRISTKNEELDRVLGGGLVPGALVLLGGDPGIGKSTLLLDAAENFGQSGNKVLYVSGEESNEQLKLRANRMDVKSEEISFLPQTNLEAIIQTVLEERPKIAIIDSIQTIYSDEISSSPGSITQIRESTNQFLKLAKNEDITIILVGHVTKEGNLAGPRILEHMVDTVLYFEGEAYHNYRMLRAVKNRFGATNEIGLFEMGDTGLIPVKNPSEMMLQSRPKNTAGSVVVPSINGMRPLLIELQALVSDSSYNNARRMATGFDFNRMTLLIAILEKRLGISLRELDCYCNIVGGIRSDEPALDLAVVFALYSSYINKSIPPDLIIFGEVGLTGEVREVQFGLRRVLEAQKLGFKHCILPRANMKEIKDKRGDMNFYPVDNISQALNILKNQF